MSELKRAARALVETRGERFESRHALAESQARFASALERARPGRASDVAAEWSAEGGRAVLSLRFSPPTRTVRALQMISLGLVLAVGASAWAIATQDGALRFLLPLSTVLAVLALPFVALGLNSQREAGEARVLKAARVALLDEEERFPQQQRWKDED